MSVSLGSMREWSGESINIMGHSPTVQMPSRCLCRGVYRGLPSRLLKGIHGDHIMADTLKPVGLEFSGR